MGFTQTTGRAVMHTSRFGCGYDSSPGCHQTGVPSPLATIRKMPASSLGYSLKMEACVAKALAMLVVTSRLRMLWAGTVLRWGGTL